MDEKYKRRHRGMRRWMYGLLLSLCIAAFPAVAQAQSPVTFDFETSNGAPLTRGQVVDSITKSGLTMDIAVESNGAFNTAMIFDSANPGQFDPDLGAPNEECPGGGPGQGAGGTPDGVGPNCLPLGNVLIIPRDVPAAAGGPNDDAAGGTIFLTFSQPVTVNYLELLDIEEDGLDIKFFSPSGVQLGEIFEPMGLGNNSYEEFIINIDNVKTIELIFPGSGALDSVNVTPPPAANASVGDYVWLDANEDGIQNEAAESGVNGVLVKLVNVDNSIVDTTTTANHPISGNPGYYRFSNITPGSYYVQFERPDGFAFTVPDVTDLVNGSTDSDAQTDTGRTALFTLQAGDFDPTWDAGLIESELGSIGDTVWYDTNGNGIQDNGEAGVPGVTVTLTDSTGNVTSTTTTDTGFYLFTELPAGTYTVTVDTNTGGLATDTYVQTADPDGILDNQSTVDLAQGENNYEQDFGYRAETPVVTGSIGDTVWLDANANGIQEPDEPGISDVQLVVIDSTGVVSTTTTDADGFYLVDNLPAGTYTVTVNADTLPPNYVQTYDLDGVLNHETTVTLDAGQDRRDVDFGYRPQPPELGSIGDTVWLDRNGNGVQDPSEPGIADVQLVLQTTLGIIETTRTNSNGLYLFTELPADEYTVLVDTTTLPPNVQQTYDLDGTLDNQTTITLDTGEVNLDVDFGYRPAEPIMGSIGDLVWCDTNGNGIQDADENGLADVTLTLLDGTGNVIATTSTDANGFYLFDNVPPGAYTVTVDASTLPTNCNIPGTDPDGTADNESSLTLSPGEDRLDIDFGYEPEAAPEFVSIGDLVWCDVDNDGAQGSDEDGLGSVQLTLLDSAGNVVATTTTDVDGNYLFTDLTPGSYTVVVDQSTLPESCDIPGTDPDGTLDNQTTVDLNPGDNPRDVDFGYRPPGMPQLIIRKYDNRETVAPGDLITYTLVFTNTGTGPSHGVLVQEIVPAHTTFVAASSTAGWFCEGGGVEPGAVCMFQAGTLEPGASKSLVFGVQVDATLPSNVTQIVNQVVVSDDSGTPPGQGGDNSVTPLRPPTSLDETDEPALDENLYIPIIQQ